MAEIEDGEIRRIDNFSYNIGKEYTIEKTKEFLKSVIPVYEHPNTIIEEYVKYMEE